ncbi:hypothetical protein D3C85_1715940 [compost metagenome]
MAPGVSIASSAGETKGLVTAVDPMLASTGAAAGGMLCEKALGMLCAKAAGMSAI